jgi:hypothetical protein
MHEYRTIGQAYKYQNWRQRLDELEQKNCLKRGVTHNGYFHYTTFENAIQILKPIFTEDADKEKYYNDNPYNSIWVSHFMYLNDREEFLDGIKKIEKICKDSLPDHVIKIFEELREGNIHQAPNHFALSLCTDGNLLTQWYYYASNNNKCGIAIEFDLENCEAEGFNSSNEFIEYAYPISPYRVLYDDKEKIDAIIKLHQCKKDKSIKEDDFLTCLYILSSFMKHPCFKTEKEVRLLFAPTHNGLSNAKEPLDFIRFRGSKNLIKPYIDIHIKHKKSENKNEYPIKSVTIGPGIEQKLVFQAMQQLIQRMYDFEPPREKPKPNEKKYYEYVDIGSIQLRRSMLPFRG